MITTTAHAKKWNGRRIERPGVYKMTKGKRIRDSEIGGTILMPRNMEFLVTAIKDDGTQFLSPACGWQFVSEFPARFLGLMP